MKRIGIDAHMLGDHSGGNERYYTNILRSMSVPEGYRIFLFVKQGVDVSAFENKYDVVRFKSQNAFVRNFVELSVLASSLRLDVLHTQYFIPFIRSCRVLCTIHDICFEHFKDIFTKKEYIRQKLLIPYAARHSQKVFTVSEHARQDIIEHYGIPENNVVVTYNAVSEDFRKLTKDELDEAGLRQRFDISDKRFILSVCNLQPRKNLVRLIRAFTALKEKYEIEEQLVIVGKKAWMYDDILSEAIQNAKDIIFTDYVDGLELVRLYNAAHCFVYPSFFEGFGIPPLEAMACGTPVAVSDATSLPEVVGDAGIYFDPFDTDKMGEAIKLLLDDSGLCEELREKGFKRVKQFSWEKSAEKIIQTYKQI